MFEFLFFGSVLLILLSRLLISSDAAITTAFVICLIAVVALFLKYPVIAIILLVVLLIIGFLLVSRKKNTSHDKANKSVPEDTAETLTAAKCEENAHDEESKIETTSSSTGGCILGILGFTIMLPGSIAAFIALVLMDHVIGACLALFACIFIGYNIMHYGADS